MNKTFCDRCGRERKFRPYAAIPHDVGGYGTEPGVVTVEFTVRHSLIGGDRDYCEHCLITILDAWVRRKRERGEWAPEGGRQRP